MSQSVPERRPAGDSGESESVAGRSARTIAHGAEAAAETLERKAAYARRMAANFQQGAAGEAATASALAELSSHGWFVLHDRLAPSGGNIDHLLVGPGGLVVVDSKNWTGEVRLSNHELRVGGRNRTAQVACLAKLTDSVKEAAHARGLAVPVHAVLALTQDLPPDGPLRMLAGPLVAGVPEVAAAIRMLPVTSRPSQVDELVAAALVAFPSADRDVEEARAQQSSERQPGGELYKRGNIFLYVEPWARSGRRRLYLNDVDGRTLGFKDLLTSDITVSVNEQEKVVRGVLANAHLGGLALSRSALPKIPVRLPGGRLLGHLGGLWSSFLIAHHWRRGPKDRLYVTHAVMDQGIFELGHIDLATGQLQPSSDEPLAKELREPRTYLERVAERYQRR